MPIRRVNPGNLAQNIGVDKGLNRQHQVIRFSGNAGVFPGAVLAAANQLKLDMDEKIKLMLTTAVIGIAMSKDHNYSAELYGCQVEPRRDGR